MATFIHEVPSFTKIRTSIITYLPEYNVLHSGKYQSKTIHQIKYVCERNMDVSKSKMTSKK